MKRGFALLSRLGHLERGLDIWFKVREGKEKEGGREKEREERREGRGERNVEELRDT